MRTSEPPRLSTWLLERLAPRDKRESLVGDLLEQYREGRSAMWYRRQVCATIWAGVVADLRAHKLMAVRAVVIGGVAVILLTWLSEALRRSLFPWFATRPWGESEILRQVLVYYRLPFALIACLGLVLTGWMIARWHRDHRAAMVVVGALSPLPLAVQWSVETGRLLQAGLWPFWDFRLALLFHAALLFVGYPLCILIGGLRGARSDGEVASRMSIS